MANARVSPGTVSGETTSDDDEAQDFPVMDPSRYRLRLAISFTYQKESVSSRHREGSMLRRRAVPYGWEP